MFLEFSIFVILKEIQSQWFFCLHNDFFLSGPPESVLISYFIHVFIDSSFLNTYCILKYIYIWGKVFTNDQKLKRDFFKFQ